MIKLDKNTIFFTIIFFFCASIYLYAQERKYDFVVPDDGTFNQAIQKANNRPDTTSRFYIFVRKGNYHIGSEDNPITSLHVPRTTIIGEGMNNTQLFNTPKVEGISVTSTLFLDHADSTEICDIELWCNYANLPDAFANRAVALNEKNCKGNRLKRVSLKSTQDTYYTNNNGTTFLDSCKICGTVDFICGGGTIVFNRCTILLLSRLPDKSKDIIVAPATEEDRQYGYVFVGCTIDGAREQEGRYLLGRAWRKEPKVLFVNTDFRIKPSSSPWATMKDCHWNSHEIIF